MHRQFACTVLAILSLLAALVPAGAPPVAAAGAYTITDLGTLGGPTSRATDLNNAGQVAGFATTAPGQQLGQAGTRAFLWDRGALTDLGTLGGPTSNTSAINDRGQVAGGALTASGEEHAFRWDNGAMTDLGTGGGTLSRAVRINTAGQVAGLATTAPGQQLDGPGTHPVLWDGGRPRDLGTLGGSTGRANGLNDRGQVVGVATTADETPRAFLWDRGRMTDLGGLPGYPVSYAIRINPAGQVVGWAGTAPTTAPDVRNRAFLYREGRLVDLGTLPGYAGSRAYGLNAAGQVVGYADRDPGTSGPRRAVLWDRGALTDLNSLLPPGSGWELTGALGINDAGQIVGGGVINGQEHAYLLTPAAMPGLPNTGGGDAPAQAPPPAGLLGALGLLLLLGGIALGPARRRPTR